MARGRRMAGDGAATDVAHMAVQDALAAVQSRIDVRIIDQVASDLALTRDDLVGQVARMRADVDEDPDIWHSAARTAALLHDPALAEACLSQLQNIARQYNRLGRTLIEGADDVPFGHDALWDRGSAGSGLWVRMSTQWGHQGLTIGEVRQELQLMEDDAMALTVDRLRAGRDIAGERASVAGVDVRASLRRILGESLAEMLAREDVDGAIDLAVAFHDAVGEPERAAQARALTAEQRTLLARIARAQVVGDPPIVREHLLDAIARISVADVDELRAPRLTGPLGDVAMGRLGPDDTGWGDRLDLARWEHTAARVLATPRLLGYGDLGADVPALGLAPGDLMSWRERYEGHPAFSGWTAGVRTVADDPNLHLVGTLDGEVDGVAQRIAVAVPVGSVDEDTSARQMTRRIIDTLEALGCDVPDLPRELPVVSLAGSAVVRALVPARAPVPTPPLVSPPACLHTRATWRRNLPEASSDALVLCCDGCGARALSVVPLHRAPGERIADEQEYLKREAMYAALEGRDVPTSLAALRRAEPQMSLALADHLPHLALPDVPAEDLGAALFG